MNFGEHAALGGSCFRHKDGVIRGEGWLQRDGKSLELKDVVIESDYKPDSIVHTGVRLKATTSEGLGFTGRGEGIAVFATVLLDRC